MIPHTDFTFTPNIYTHKGVKHANNVICFDTESSSAWLDVRNRPTQHSAALPPDWYRDKVKVSLPYIWMLSVDGTVYYGRTLQDFKQILDLLDAIEVKIIIWVHNLSWDINFLFNILDFDRIFARKPHRPITADWHNIQFRCTYMLTRLSLDKWGEAVKSPIKKLRGYLDYDKIRTPKTYLTPRELAYCEHDVKVMHYGITWELKQYKHLSKIPLTQTGKTREVVKRIYHDDTAYHRLMTNLLPSTDMYAREMAAMRGGDTNCSYLWYGKYLDDVKSMDLTSGYPAWMAYYKYPMTPWQRVRNLNDWGDEYSKLIDVTFYGLQSRGFCSYLPIYKALNVLDIIKNRNNVKFNGRIVSCDKARYILTDIDFDIVKRSYEIGDVEINGVWVSRAEYLDRRYVKFDVDMFKGKTIYDGVDYELYMQAKGRTNALFGMMGSALIQANVLFSQHADLCAGEKTWDTERLTASVIDAKLQELHKKPYKNFLRYAHAAWVLAYGRQALWESILAIGDDVVYYDTDSNKHLRDHQDVFDAHNAKIKKLMEETCERVGVTMDDLNPISPKGKQKHLGFWADDGDYTEFVTLGAKRYCYRDRADKKLHITVSGVKKSQGVKALDDDIRNFNDDTVFGYGTSGATQIYYLTDQPSVVWNAGEDDEWTSDDKFGVALFPGTYTMSPIIDTDYLNAILQNCEFKSNDNIITEVLTDAIR